MFFFLTACSSSKTACSKNEIAFVEEQKPARTQEGKKAAEGKRRLKICLDAGHGGKDPGAPKMRCKVSEKYLCLDVAKRIEHILQHAGCQVILTRSSDTYIPLAKRVEIANQQKADIFVSIHFNTSSYLKTEGIEVFYFNDGKNSPRTVRSKLLGNCVITQLQKAIATQNRGVKHGNFCVVRETHMPSILVEAAFMTNPKEAKLLSSKDFLQSIALGISKGIEDFFQKDRVRPGKS